MFSTRSEILQAAIKYLYDGNDANLKLYYVVIVILTVI